MDIIFIILLAVSAVLSAPALILNFLEEMDVIHARGTGYTWDRALVLVGGVVAVASAVVAFLALNSG